jgi:hypothetical protein
VFISLDLLVQGVLQSMADDGARFSVLRLIRLLHAERRPVTGEPTGGGRHLSLTTPRQHWSHPDRVHQLAGAADAQP